VRKMKNEEVHEKMWKGAESRFKVIPWGAMQGRGLKAPREREVWKRRVEREEARREKRKSILGDYGYEFDIPTVKKVETVANKGHAIEDNGEVKAITNGDEAVDAFVAAGLPLDTVALKQQKSKKTKQSPIDAAVVEGHDAIAVEQQPKKVKKQKKSKAAVSV
jgi:nucleolar protein 15